MSISLTGTTSASLSGIVKEHVDAINAFDVDRIMATFDDDAYLNDFNREIWGADQIRYFFQKEFIGDQITMEVQTVTDHFGDVIVTAVFDGTFDRTMLPDGEAPVLSTYYSLRNDKIASLFIMSNKPWPGPPARLLEEPPRPFDATFDRPAVWPYSDGGPEEKTPGE